MTMDVNGLPQLSNGDADEWVEYLQQLLTQAGYSTGGVDGKFGANTQYALESFQQAMGFEATGVTDTQTWEMLVGLGGMYDAAQQLQAVTDQYPDPGVAYEPSAQYAPTDVSGDDNGYGDTIIPQADTTDVLHPGHPQWATVTAKLEKIAERNLNVMVERMQLGADAFRDDANDMITEYIKEPPKDLDAFAAIADAVMGSLAVFIPGAGLIAGLAASDLIDAVKIVYDEVKLAKGVWDKAGEIEVSRSVEGAKEQLKQLTGDFAEDFGRRAVSGYERSLNTLEATITDFLTQHPQPVPADDAAHAALCLQMGLGPTLDSAVDQFATEIMKPFRKAVMTQTASLHFFKELDNDFERLNFLMDEGDKGNPVEPLLELIGADVEYWKKFLDVYRTSGRDVAIQTLQYYLTRGRMP